MKSAKIYGCPYDSSRMVVFDVSREKLLMNSIARLNRQYAMIVYLPCRCSMVGIDQQ